MGMNMNIDVLIQYSHHFIQTIHFNLRNFESDDVKSIKRYKTPEHKSHLIIHYHFSFITCVETTQIELFSAMFFTNSIYRMRIFLNFHYLL